MPALQIRNVPNEVRDTLAAQARAHGQSMQRYLLAIVEREAATARNKAVLDEIAAWPSSPSEASCTVEDVLKALDDARARRDID